jgi:hypothetical protein
MTLSGKIEAIQLSGVYSLNSTLGKVIIVMMHRGFTVLHLYDDVYALKSSVLPFVAGMSYPFIISSVM